MPTRNHLLVDTAASIVTDPWIIGRRGGGSLLITVKVTGTATVRIEGHQYGSDTLDWRYIDDGEITADTEVNFSNYGWDSLRANISGVGAMSQVVVNVSWA